LRYLVLSDIHANLEALETVLAAAPEGGTWDRVLVLGDLVGYGADPNGVIACVRALNPLAVIRGNHDKAACGVDDASAFNHLARQAAEWTYETLTDEHRTWLRELPAGPAVIDDGLEICHGAPFDEDAYIFDGRDAARAFETSTRPLCLFGHTHLPVIFLQSASRFEGTVPEGETYTLPLEPGIRYLVNPGSVGQPRDGDPRAAFAIYDGEKRELALRRVEYPVAEAQQKITAAGLPVSLANRLGLGR
jgi:diadenosine tetraphosphatase ApaH/serine/threonine PP2A family protein phosphatase